jgi:hypothetical protein
MACLLYEKTTGERTGMGALLWPPQPLIRALQAFCQLEFVVTGVRSMKVSIGVLVAACSLLTSCLPGTSSLKYTEPLPATLISNEKIIAKPFADTWDVLVRELAKMEAEDVYKRYD